MQRLCGKAIFFALGIFLLVGVGWCASRGEDHRHQDSAAPKPGLQVQSIQSRNVGGPFHIVKQGDTLYEIARVNRLTVRELKEANHLRRNRLKIGQRLTLAHARRLSLATRRKGKSSSATLDEALREASNNAPRNSVDPSSRDNTGTRAEVTGQSSEGSVKNPEGMNPEQAPQTLRYRLVSAGFDFLGVPYQWRGMSEKRGFDCSGLVKKLFDEHQIELPHSSREQFKLGEKVARAELEIGDLVFFSSRGKIPTHVGIYIGDNQFLHAASKARQVIISNLGQKWYTKRFLGARRISDLWKDEQKPAEAKGN